MFWEASKILFWGISWAPQSCDFQDVDPLTHAGMLTESMDATRSWFQLRNNNWGLVSLYEKCYMWPSHSGAMWNNHFWQNEIELWHIKFDIIKNLINHTRVWIRAPAGVWSRTPSWGLEQNTSWGLEQNPQLGSGAEPPAGVWSRAPAGVWSRAPAGVWSRAPAGVWSRAPAGVWSRAPSGVWSRAPAGIWSRASVGVWSRAPAGVWSKAPAAHFYEALLFLYLKN